MVFRYELRAAARLGVAKLRGQLVPLALAVPARANHLSNGRIGVMAPPGRISNDDDVAGSHLDMTSARAIG